MKKNLLLKIFICFISLIVCLYAFIVVAVPKILSSEYVINKLEQYIYKKYNYSTQINDLNVQISPLLKFSIAVEKLVLKDNNNHSDIANINDFSYISNKFSIFPSNIKADYIYIDCTKLPKMIKGKKKNNNNFDIKFFPIVNINKIFVKVNKDNNIQISDIKSLNQDNIIETTFLAKVNSKYADKSLLIGEEGRILYDKNLYIDNLSLNLDGIKLFVTGDIDDLSIVGNNIDVNKLEKYFLKFFKLTHNNKRNFIENFEKFKGTLDVNLKIQNKAINGICITRNLGANFSTLKIPVTLPRTVLYFHNREMHAKSNGLFGNEKVSVVYNLQGIATKNLHSQGTVHSKFTDKFTRVYFKQLKIEGYADALVKFDVKNQVVNMDYILTLNPNNSFLFIYGITEYMNSTRQLRVHTIKNGDDIYMNKYQGLYDGDEIFNGDGLFKKVKGHYKPSYISLKTNGDISFDLFKPFIKSHFHCGSFNANFKYLFDSASLQGYINFNNLKYYNYLTFHNLNIFVENKYLKMNTTGSYFNSPITMDITAQNSLKSGLIIDDIKIYLKKYTIVKSHINDIHKDINELKHNAQKHPHKNKSAFNIEVKKGKLSVDEVSHSRFTIKKVSLYGSLKNHVVDFVIPYAEYAQGVLSGVGEYNIKNKSSNIKFFASEIDSNESATHLFKLKNQIEGKAYGILHFKSWDNLDRIYAEATFAVENGSLPTIGTREFAINNKKTKKNKLLFFLNKPIKFTLSKITNIDFTKQNIFYSNLRGAFVVDQNMIKDLKVFSQGDSLSMYIEGDYDMDKEYANLNIWGKHNKTVLKKIRIFKIPISWLYKLFFRTEKSKEIYEKQLDLVPPVKGDEDEIRMFRINAYGNINTSDKKVELKNLK